MPTKNHGKPPTPPSSSSPRVVEPVLSTSWGVSIPILVLIVTVVVSNLTMFFNMQARTSVLNEQFKAVVSDVGEIKATISKFTAETSAELRALRKENTQLRETFNAQITELKVKLAEHGSNR